MNPPKIKKTVVNKKPSNQKWKWMGVFSSVMAPIVFYAQGRVYVEAYLRYFGVELPASPLPPTDIYWHAFMAWIELLKKVSNVLANLQPDFLGGIWPLLALSLVGSWILWRLSRRDDSQAVPENKTENHTSLGNRLAQYAALGLMNVGFIALLLLMPILLISFIVIFIIIFFVPFDDLGKRQACEDYMATVENYATVHYVEHSLSSETIEKNIASAKLLKCYPEFCILIQEGKALVVPKTDIRPAEGRRIGEKTSNAPAPAEQRLCAK